MAKTIVVGAGAFGAWSALELAMAGHRVTLVDAYGPGNGRASSADHSRVIRAGYGADAMYSHWATASLDRWQWLSHEAGVPLFERTGALFMGPPGHDYIRQTHDTLSTLGLGAEWMDPAAVASRWPQIAIGGLGPAVYEPDAGVLRARACVRAAVRLAVDRYGVTYRTALVQPVDEARRTLALEAAGGEQLAADAYVFACGPWLPAVFPWAVGPRIRPTRQEVLYFGVPAGSDRFAAKRLPVWIDFASGLYGIPDVDGHGFKVGIDRHGSSIDPDTADRVVDPAIVAVTRQWLASRFPAMAGAPLVDARVCQYENTCTGDFILDRHPAWSHVWIAGGGSGHGFKHGPAVGRYVAELVDERGTAHPRFALAAKTALAQRAVF
jgi:monomeric sarcosine oxidase